MDVFTKGNLKTAIIAVIAVSLVYQVPQVKKLIFSERGFFG